MWYRLILAARVVTDKEGERSVHQTQNKYRKPIFPFDDPELTGAYSINGGAGGQVFGPGHYTATSPPVTKGYKDKPLPYRREEKLPMGTRIIHYDKLTNDEIKEIINAWNKKFNTNYNYEDYFKEFGTTYSGTIRNLFKFLGDWNHNKLYVLLVELGYDAVEHDVGRTSSGKAIEENLEKLKSDPEYFTKGGRFKKRKYRRAVQNKLGTNVIVINRAIITKPDLFQKIRFRPDSVTPEEMQEYKDEIQTTSDEVIDHILSSGGVYDLSLKELCRTLERGKYYPQFDKNIEKFNPNELALYGYKFEDRLKYLKILTRYYDDRVVFNLFTPKEIEENQDLIRNNLSQGPINNSINKARAAVLTYNKLERQLLGIAYNYQKTRCNSYGCGKELDRNAQKCDKCGGDMIAHYYESKSNLDFLTLIKACSILAGLKTEINLTRTADGAQKLQNVYHPYHIISQFIEQFKINALEFKTSNKLREFRTKFQPFINLFAPEQLSDLNEFLVNQLNILDSQPTQKVAYKILQKTAGKVKYYYFNGDSKPLRDHLQDIFPYANSVDIFYMMDRLRRKAMSDDQVANLLYEAAMGRLFPRFEDKRV
jgi:hypothetical protein